MVHLVCDRMDESDEFRAMIEGGGVCIAKVFASAFHAECWLHELFRRMFRNHRCDLGCMRMPGHEFLANAEQLERLAGLPDLRRR
jgi:hypothetical protein